MLSKVMIVDDERLARVELKRLLSNYTNQLKIVAEAENTTEASKLLKQTKIDVIFLDIHMPGINGLEFAKSISTNIKVVFCTAYDEHAIEAFTINAIDYLLKPIDPQRLSKTIEKIQSQNIPEENSKNNYLPDNHGLLLKFGTVSKIVRLKDIERFESQGNNVAIYTQRDKTYILSTLKKVEENLDPNMFFKVSRSDIIRVDCIRQIHNAIEVGGLVAEMKSGLEIDISRRQASVFKSTFNLSIN